MHIFWTDSSRPQKMSCSTTKTFGQVDVSKVSVSDVAFCFTDNVFFLSGADAHLLCCAATPFAKASACVASHTSQKVAAAWRGYVSGTWCYPPCFVMCGPTNFCSSIFWNSVVRLPNAVCTSVHPPLHTHAHTLTHLKSCFVELFGHCFFFQFAKNQRHLPGFSRFFLFIYVLFQKRLFQWYNIGPMTLYPSASVQNFASC